MIKSNSYCNGLDKSAYNGNGLGQHRHGWFCACHWCLNGHR